MKVCYFDCTAGVAGDMVLGALVDAGAGVYEVERALRALELPGWDLSFEDVDRASIRAKHAIVRAEETHDHRHLSDIERIISSAELDPFITDLAIKTFRVLAEAEARVHGVPVEKVHFHEVGAVDAIVDIVGCAAALRSLEIEKVICSPIEVGSGTVKAAHGTIPVPAPAVVELMRDRPMTSEGSGENATPTGVALMAACADAFGQMPPMVLGSVGIGAGTRDTAERPNVVRVFVGEVEEAPVDGGGHLLLETNIDDMNPEIVPYAIERLLGAGAQDAWATPIVMKKGRPAFSLSILAHKDQLPEILETLYAETTTLGVRMLPTGKHTLEREWITVHVEGYEVRVKLGKLGGRITNAAPEYEDAVKVAKITGLALKEVYRLALEQAPRQD